MGDSVGEEAAGAGLRRAGSNGVIASMLRRRPVGASAGRAPAKTRVRCGKLCKW
ncbi:hypothetical protein EPIRMAN_GEN20614_09695 [Ralstonia mannitolilytica]|nr:hypothetical protein LMG6866_03329 [Ralstonia mannitolilytica]CAJ0726304.1 hypothetical protein R77592_00942 [Ralstonia mannitolilytica]CAJ0728984.1 hypothetical protein R76706_01885 [Ralstonia mannitolilytica]